MTDNITLPGTGLVTATEDRDGIHYQKVLIDNMPFTAFGELATAYRTPQTQIKFPYGIINADLARGLTNKSGSSVSATGGQAVITCSSSAQAFSQLLTNTPLRYGPGQGAVAMGTCLFSSGVANSTQIFGAGDDDEGFFFGYNGTSFGVLRRSGGSLEIRELTITAAATSSNNITITVDGTAVVVAVTSGDTISQVAEKIVAAASDFFNAGRGWEVTTTDSVSIQFLSLVAENAAGSFSFSGGSTGVTGSWATLVTGVAPTQTWVTQDNWNVDTMDGNGPSGMTLDQTKGNVYRIQFQYLGYGMITFSIENSTTGTFQTVHQIRYANANTTPSLVNPSLPLSCIIKTETGYSGGSLTLKTASMASFVEGMEDKYQGIRRSMSATKTIGTTENVLLSLRNSLAFNSKYNKVSVYPDHIAYSNDGGKTVEIVLYDLPARVAGGAAHTNVETNVSSISYSSTGTTITGGKRLITIQVGAGQSGVRDLKGLELSIRPGRRWVFSARALSGAGGDVTISSTWIERV